ncbi:sodium/mannose cotransporter SLC5A10-like isoform X1 [Macrobrachium rosenbergii]|uniref:sodium/mannose cotransporter SLC5A10-like isoform X1 n=2 Tax=Macrobrachium rosenbergii TaxID=79674 RepID=UPI0034D5FB6F
MTDIVKASVTTMGSSDDEVRLAWPDAFVIVVYFCFVLLVGLWSSRRNQHGTLSSYFLASRDMHWIPVGASLFASNIGSGHFIGLAGAGAASGIAVAGFELGSVYTLMMLGWLFVPVYMSSEVYTMPEYLSKRFGGKRIRIYLSFLALILYIFTKISADLYAGALFMQLAMNKSSDEWLYISILILLGIAAIFTIVGGLAAVVWTDFIQIILMVVGAFILMGTSLNAVGGYQALVDAYPEAKASVQSVDLFNNSCGNPPEDYMSLFRSVQPGKSEYPWTGMVIGVRLNAIWYWCTDQVIVQRTLASKSMCHAKGGCVLAAYLKFLPLWLLVIPGMAARVLYPDRVACATPDACRAICGNPSGCSNIAYAELVLNLLPTGLSGLMLAVMMAALMTSLTSIFNSASTIFTIDVWMLFRARFSRQRAKPTETELLVVGKVFVMVLVVISVLWIPVIQTSGNSQLFHYIQRISSFLAPPICAVFVLAVFWGRTNEPGAFWGLMFGLFVGMVRFVLEFAYTVPTCGSGLPDVRPELIKILVGNIHYTHFSIILWILTGIVTISISLMTTPIPPECLYRLTFWTRKDSRVRKSHKRAYDESDINKHMESVEVMSGSSVEEFSIENPPPVGSKWKRMINVLCGVYTTDPEAKEAGFSQSTPEQLAKAAADFLYEPPFWNRFINWNCFICLALCTVIVIYYA